MVDPVVVVVEEQGHHNGGDSEVNKQKQSYVKHMIVIAMVTALITIGVVSYSFIRQIVSSGEKDSFPQIHDSDDWHKLKMKKYPNGPAIRFKSFMDEENTISDKELSFGYLLTRENNLALDRAKILAMTNSVKRQLPGGEEIIEEPYRQFIVKLKSEKVTKTSILNMLETHNLETNQQQPESEFNKNAVKFNNILAPGVVSIVGKASELINHIGEENSIEWIGEYENRFKSTLNFKKIQQRASEMKRNVPHVGTFKRSIANTTHIGGSKVNNNHGLDPNLVEVIVSLVPSLDALRKGAEKEEAETFAKHFNTILSEKYVSGIEFKPMIVLDETKCSLSFSPHIAVRVGDLLMENPNVHFIERKLALTTHNKFAHSLMQNVDPSLVSGTPMYDLGITGTNQVVAVADTGLDFDNCFFSDSARSMSFDTMNNMRRKVVYYRTSYADNYDGINGHGTHVCGSVAGSIENADLNTGLNQYHGVAPSAKLFFTDLEKTSRPGSLMIPDPITNLFSFPYSMGVKIFSNSFGCGPEAFVDCQYNCQNCKLRISVQGYAAGASVTNNDCKLIFGVPTCCDACNVYNTQCQDIDKFLWNNKDAIILFSQGNSGALSEFGNTGYPAVSKNTLTVGAHQTSNAGFVDGINYEDYLNKMKEAGLPWTSTADCCAYSGFNRDIVRAYCCPSFIKSMYTNQQSNYNENNLASFSSRGPAMGGRIKPDLVAIGHTVISSHSDGSTTTKNCGSQSPQLNNNAALYLLSGTSMATPLTAGAVALVRQFLQKTYSISNPSGTLLKAAVINSAVPLTGSVAFSNDETNRFNIKQKYGSPNFYDGFGKVQLGGLLRDKYGNPLSLIIAENAFTSQTQSARLCLRLKKTVTARSVFRSTLAWYDYPGSTSVQGGLVHDLDIYANTYIQRISTGATSGLDILIANGKTDYGDAENNVEKLEIDSITNPSNSDSALMLSIQVMNFGIMSGQSQSFTLLASIASGFWDQLSPSSCMYRTSYETTTSPQSVNQEISNESVLPPKNVQITRITQNSVQLNWENANNLDYEFNIMYDSTILKTKETSITVSGLNAGTTYTLTLFSSFEHILSTMVTMNVGTLSPRTMNATTGQTMTLRSTMVFNFEVPQGGKMVLDMPETFHLSETLSRGIFDPTFNILDLTTGDYIQLESLEKNTTMGTVTAVFAQNLPVTECIFTIQAVTTAIRDLDNFATVKTFDIDGTKIEFNTLPLPKLINPENPNPNNGSFKPIPVNPNPIVPTFSFVTNKTEETIRDLSISTGVLAGVAVLALITALAIGVILIWFVYRNKRKQQTTSIPSTMVVEDESSVYYRKDQRLE